jgi:putative hydrolase of the HAD superfamily
MIKGVIFDLDDTLTIHDDLYECSYLKVIEKFLPNYKNDSKNILNIFINTIHKIGTEKLFSTYKETKFGGRDILWGDCGGKGEVSEYLNERYLKFRIEIWKEVFNNFGIEKSKEEILKINNFYTYSMWEGIKLFDDVIPTLQNLKNMKLGILTNGMILHQRRKMAKSGILNFFSKNNRKILTSSESILGKPNNKPFEVILNKLNLSNSEVLMVGDSLESDILGANKMGITSILLNRRNINYTNNSIKPNYEINNLEKILELIF